MCRGRHNCNLRIALDVTDFKQGTAKHIRPFRNNTEESLLRRPRLTFDNNDSTTTTDERLRTASVTSCRICYSGIMSAFDAIAVNDVIILLFHEAHMLDFWWAYLKQKYASVSHKHSSEETIAGSCSSAPHDVSK